MSQCGGQECPSSENKDSSGHDSLNESDFQPLVASTPKKKSKRKREEENPELNEESPSANCSRDLAITATPRRTPGSRRNEVPVRTLFKAPSRERSPARSGIPQFNYGDLDQTEYYRPPNESPQRPHPLLERTEYYGLPSRSPRYDVGQISPQNASGYGNRRENNTGISDISAIPNVGRSNVPNLNSCPGGSSCAYPFQAPSPIGNQFAPPGSNVLGVQEYHTDDFQTLDSGPLFDYRIAGTPSGRRQVDLRFDDNPTTSRFDQTLSTSRSRSARTYPYSASASSKIPDFSTLPGDSRFDQSGYANTSELSYGGGCLSNNSSRRSPDGSGFRTIPGTSRMDQSGFANTTTSRTRNYPSFNGFGRSGNDEHFATLPGVSGASQINQTGGLQSSPRERMERTKDQEFYRDMERRNQANRYLEASPGLSPISKPPGARNYVDMSQYRRQMDDSRKQDLNISRIPRNPNYGKYMAGMNDTPETFPKREVYAGGYTSFNKQRWQNMEDKLTKLQGTLTAEQRKEKSKMPRDREYLDQKHRAEQKEFNCYCAKERYKMIHLLKHNKEDTLTDQDLFGSILDEDMSLPVDQPDNIVHRLIAQEQQQSQCPSNCNPTEDLSNLGEVIEDYFNLYVGTVITDATARYAHMLDAIECFNDYKDDYGGTDCHFKRRIEKALRQLESNEEKERHMICRKLMKRRLKLIADYLKTKDKDMSAASIKDDIKPKTPNVTSEEARIGYISGDAAAQMIREEANRDSQLQKDYAAFLESRPDKKSLAKYHRKMEKEIYRRYQDFDELWDSFNTSQREACGLNITFEDPDDRPVNPMATIFMGEVIQALLFRQYQLQEQVDQMFDSEEQKPKCSGSCGTNDSDVQNTMEELSNFHLNMAKDFWMAMEWMCKILKDKEPDKGNSCSGGCFDDKKDEQIRELFQLTDTVHKKYHQIITKMFLQQEGAEVKTWRELREEYSKELKEVMDAFNIMDFSKELSQFEDNIAAKIDADFEQSKLELEEKFQRSLEEAESPSKKKECEKSFRVEMDTITRMRREFQGVIKQEMIRQRLAGEIDIDLEDTKCVPTCFNNSDSLRQNMEQSQAKTLASKPAKPSCKCQMVPELNRHLICSCIKSREASCLCKSSIVNVDQLEQMEVTEMEELERSLKQWQAARRNVLTTMGNVSHL